MHSGMYGMYALQESVRQIRGIAPAQVDDVEISVAHGSRRHCFAASGTVIFGPLTTTREETAIASQTTKSVWVHRRREAASARPLCERFCRRGAPDPSWWSIATATAPRLSLRRSGGRAEVVDVGSEHDLTHVAHRHRGRPGSRSTWLCNNAGIASGGDPLSTPIEEWQRQWDINVMSHVYAIRAVLPSMLARGEGHIQHTASMAGILTSHGNAPYATSKHAVVGLAEWMSITYHDAGIRTYLLAPLGVRTPIAR